MNVLVVDTSAWISYFGGKSLPRLNSALKEGRVYLPAVVAAELLSARLGSKDRSELESFLRELPLCDASFDHWVRVGGLRSRCASKGVNLSTPDAHIAQCALDLEGSLVTEDKVFDKMARFSGLQLSKGTT